MNLTDVAALYKIARSTLDRYLDARKEELSAIATRYKYKGKEIKKTDLNKKQIKLIVEILQDTPEGYKLVRGKLVKLNENE